MIDFLKDIVKEIIFVFCLVIICFCLSVFVVVWRMDYTTILISLPFVIVLLLPVLPDFFRKNK